ncbi:hypothetical protein A4A49_65983, partial [Nicotiana attenuata]
PIILNFTPPPLDHTPTSWLEVPLQGQGTCYNFQLRNQPITLIIQNPTHLARVTILETLNKGLATFGTQLWQSMILQSSFNPLQPNNNAPSVHNLMQQIFNLIPFFPDPATTPQFSPQQDPSSSAPEKQQSPPLGNISREITKALEKLKGQEANKEVANQSSYCPLRTNSLWLEAVRAVEFSMDYNDTLIYSAPKHLPENSAHIFFDCPNAESFWQQLTSQSTTITQSQPPTFTSRSLSNTWSTLRRKPFNNIHSWEDLFPFSFWQLWIIRNNNLFNKKKDSIPTYVVLAKVTEDITISVNQTPTKEKTIWVKWVPPLIGHYNLNNDGASLGNLG